MHCLQVNQLPTEMAPLHPLIADLSRHGQSTDLQHNLCVLGHNGDDTRTSLHLAKGLTVGCSSTAQASLKGWRQHIYQHTWHTMCPSQAFLCGPARLYWTNWVNNAPEIFNSSGQEEDLLVLSTAVYKVEICPLYNRITKLNRPDERSTERCKGPVSWSLLDVEGRERMQG